GVTLRGSFNKVLTNIIHDVSYAGTDCAAIHTAGAKGFIDELSSDHEIAYNTLYNSGRGIIVHRNIVRSKIWHNEMFNAGLLTTDMGVTYSYLSNGEDTRIAYNLIHDSFNSGI